MDKQHRNKRRTRTKRSQLAPSSRTGSKRILVIGSEGTIGTVLVARLAELGHEVWRTDRVKMKAENYIPSDITRHETLSAAFEKAKPELVFHLAGEVSREICEHWPTVAAEANVLGTMNVALLCLDHNARVVYAGSSEEYGDAFRGGPVTEHTVPGSPQGIYALTKWMAEEVLVYWHRTRGLSVVTTRLFMCYGQERPTAYRSAISQFIYRSRKGEDLIVHRGGKRQWCYITDIVEGMIASALYRWGDSIYEVFLLGREETVEMEDVAKEIIDILGSTSHIRLVDPPQGVTPVKEGIFKKALHLLGWQATVPFGDGLRREMEWQEKNAPLGMRGEP